MTVVRVAILALLLAIIGWLAVDGAPMQRRIAAVNQALSLKQLGGLADEEADQVGELLRRLVAAAGLDLPVVLNKPLQPQTPGERIQVFTSSPAAREVSRAERGNAIYDGTVDAIFIDLDIVRPARASTMYARVQVFEAFVQAPSYDYLAFVFLHELGHRVLHRDRKILLDTVLHGASGSLQQYEREADAFALRALRAAYDKTGEIGLRTGPKPIAPYEPKREPFEAALADMINSTVRSLLFSAVPYSPFYTDAAHPTFLSRTLGFLENRSKDAEKLPGILRIVQEGLSRIAEVASRPLLEIQVPGTIEHIKPVSNGVIILTKEGGRYSVASRVFEHAENAGVRRVVAVRDPDGQTPPPETENQPAANAVIGLSAGARLMLLPDLPGKPLGTSLDTPLSLKSAALLVAAIADVTGRPHDGNIEKAVASFTGALQSSGFPGNAGFVLLGIANQRAHALIVSPDDAVVGIAALSTDDYKAVKFDRLNLDTRDDDIVRGASRFHAVPTTTGVDYYLIEDRWTSTGPEATGAQICIWKISTNPPQMLACHPLIAFSVPEWRSGNGWPAGTVLLISTAWSGPTGFVANVNGDSMYGFDPDSGSARVLFHPGGLDTVMLPSGHAIFFAVGSHKAFAVRMRDTASGAHAAALPSPRK